MSILGRLRLPALAAMVGLSACGGAASGAPVSPSTPLEYGYQVIRTFPHDPAAFTEGLVLSGGELFESTGTHGQASSLRRVELSTGRVLQRVDLPADLFGEGLTVIRDRLVQLTWRSGRGMVYDRASLALVGDFRYQGEGWGLTGDGRSLIMSDGSSRLRFLDPVTFAVQRTLSVTDRGQPVTRLNELEYVRGEIYANVWLTDTIVRIDPRTGAVLGRIDLQGLLPPNPNPDAVLNGVAWDGVSDHLLVTGKLSPQLYEIRLVRR